MSNESKTTADDFHGQGGSYIVGKDGVKRLAEPATQEHPNGNGHRHNDGTAGSPAPAAAAAAAVDVKAGKTTNATKGGDK